MSDRPRALGNVNSRYRQNREAALEQGRVDENNQPILNGTVAIPPNAPQEPSFTQIPNISADQIQNTSAIQQALSRLAETYQNTGNRTAPSANDTRRNLVAAVLAQGGTFNPQPNVLHQYANYTYHIKWSLANDLTASAISSSSQYQNISKLVIAESGVTAGFNITEFEIENYCAPGPRVQAMMHTKWKMKVLEPYGFSLMDRLFSFGRTMGVSNYLAAPYFIEVWFTGYGEDGEIKTPTMRNDIYRVFRVTVTKLEAEVTSSGTVYEIEGIFDGSYANSDTVAVAANTITISNVRTVGAFFQQLEDQMNRQQRNLSYDMQRRSEYRFQVPEWMKNWQFSQRPTVSQRSGSLEIGPGGNTSNPTIQISRGMDISNILNFVVSMTEEGQRFVAGENRQPGQATNTPNGRNGASLSANGMANVLAVHSQAQIIGFDMLTNDYIRRITYTFTRYPTTRAMVDDQNVRAALQPPQQLDRANTLLGSGRYSKMYDYIYTGLNLDIVKLDIKVEMSWAASIPLQLGENTYSNFTPPPQMSRDSVSQGIVSQYRQAQARRAEAQRILSTLPRTGGTADQRTQREIAQRISSNANVEISSFQNDASRFQVMFDTQNAGTQALTNLRVGDQRLLNEPGLVNAVAGNIAWTEVANQRRNTYLEDVRVLSVDQAQRIPIAFRTNPGPTNQITNISGESAPQRGNNSGGPQNLPASRSLVAAVLNDVNSNTFLVQAELEIRGDPYWLGLGNIEENTMIGNGNNPPPTNPNGAWFFGGETGFILTFRTGEPPSEETGYMQFSQESVAFSGLYSVLEVKSFFKNGQFLQRIKAVKDPLLPDLQAAMSSVQADGSRATAIYEQLSAQQQNLSSTRR